MKFAWANFRAGTFLRARYTTRLGVILFLVAYPDACLGKQPFP